MLLRGDRIAGSIAAPSVHLEAGVESRHVIGISREDERAQALRDDRKVGIDDIGRSGFGEPAPDDHRLIERVDVEVAHNSSKVRLSCRFPPDLGEYRVGRVKIIAAFSCPPDQGPESGVHILAVDDERAGIDDQ